MGIHALEYTVELNSTTAVPHVDNTVNIGSPCGNNKLLAAVKVTGNDLAVIKM